MQNIDSLYSRKNKILAITRLCILFSILIIIFLQPNIAYASVSDPDSSPSITNLWVNQNVASNGDRLIYGIYTLPYDTLPGIDASQTFIFRLMTLDGATEIGEITPYPRFQSGYKTGLFSFYLSSSANLSWNTSLIIRISENPAQFTSPLSWDFILSSSNYSTLTTQTLNQGELTDNLIAIAKTIGNTYSTDLIVSNGSKLVLTTAGELYFGGAVPNLQNMAPSLYLTQKVNLDLSSTNWTTTQFDAYENRFNNTWVGNDEQSTADQFGMTTTMVMSLIITLPICLAFIIFASIKFKKAEPGYLVCALILIMSVLMGWIPKALFASIYQACGIYVAYLVFYARG